jgi:hypothetical protein
MPRPISRHLIRPEQVKLSKPQFAINFDDLPLEEISPTRMQLDLGARVDC